MEDTKLCICMDSIRERLLNLKAVYLEKENPSSEKYWRNKAQTVDECLAELEELAHESK